MFDLAHLADELQELSQDDESTLWAALRLIVAEFEQAKVIEEGVGGQQKLAWACHIAADAIADASTFVDPQDKPLASQQSGYVRVKANPDDNAHSRIAIDLDDRERATTALLLRYNNEMAFTIEIVNDPADENDNVSAKAKILTWPIEGGQGEEATAILRQRGR